MKRDLGRGGDLFPQLRLVSPLHRQGGHLSSGKYARPCARNEQQILRDADGSTEHAEVLQPPALQAKKDIIAYVRSPPSAATQWLPTRRFGPYYTRRHGH